MTRRRAGIKSGARVGFKVSGGIINIIPELPNADNEYTPAQRRAIDARLAEARKGPYYGPFKTADEAIALRHREIGRGGTGTGSTVHDGPGDRLGEFGLGTVKPVPFPLVLRHHFVRVQHEFLGGAFVEIFVALRGVVE